MIHSFGDILLGRDYRPIWDRLRVQSETRRNNSPIGSWEIRKKEDFGKTFLSLNQILEIFKC